VKRSLLAIAVLAVLAIGAAFAYQTAARERDYRVLLARGDAALREDQIFAAIEAYSGAIALRSDSILPYLRRGETYQRRGDLEAAARDFHKAAALDPTAPRPLEELGDVQYLLQRYARAVETYDACLRLDDRAPHVLYKLALSQYRARHFDGAIAALNQALRLDDKDPNVYYLQGLCYREKQLVPEAATALEKAVSISPGMIPAREELADLYGSSGRHQDELAQLGILAGLDRDHVERQVAVGLAHARAGHAELAVLTLRNALERSPDQPLIYGALGQVWLNSADARNDRVDLAKALEALERVASSNAATSEVLTLYGRALLESGEPELAERALKQASERFPIDPSSFTYLATAAERLNHFDDARQALIAYGALTSDDSDLAARTGRIGLLSLKANDLPAAINWLQRATTLAPNDVRLLAPLAEAELKSGNKAEAQAVIARGLEKEPGNAALVALARRAK